MKKPEYEGMTKILFELNADGSDVEAMWAMPVDDPSLKDAYILDNSPFDMLGVSYLDTVRALPAEDGMLVFDRVIKAGGHSTYMILVPVDSVAFKQYWHPLAELGCSYENGGDGYEGGRRLLSVDVPPEADIERVLDFLDEGEEDAIWWYQEGNYEGPTPRRERAPVARKTRLLGDKPKPGELD